MASAEFSKETINCIRLVFTAVKENSVSKLQLAKKAYSEKQLLTSLVQCNKKGETPLVIAMKGKNISVFRELVTVFEKCDYKIYKFHVMFVIDQLSHHIHIFELIYYIKNNCSDGWLKFIAKVFIKSTSFTRQDKIMALELIGAYAIMTLCYAPTAKVVVCGLECWRKAMTLRYFPKDGELVLPKTPAAYVPSTASSVVLGSAVEVMTMEELHLLQEDFERDSLLFGRDVQRPCVKRMIIQALLVIRRISSQTDYGHPHWIHLENLFGFMEFIYMKMHEKEIVINSHLLILEQINGFEPKLISRQSFDIFMKTFGLLAMYFSEMLRAPPGSPEREFTYENLLVPTEFITKISKFFPEPAMISSIEIEGNSFAFFVYHFMSVLNSISPRMTNQEKQKLEEYYTNYIRNLFPERTTTVLHVAVRHYSLSCEALHVDTVKLILRLGADPNAINEDGRSPLHILAGKIIFLMSEYYVPLFKDLMDAGGHLDMATDDGDTVLSILKKNMIERKHFNSIFHPYFKSLFKAVFPLSCYAARTIRRHGIRFDEDRLPPPLQAFVQRHSVKDFTDSFHLQYFSIDCS